MIAFIKQNFLKGVMYVAFLYFAFLMILITVQYIPIDFEVAFLRTKQAEIMIPHYQIAFFSHVYTSIFVLLIGIAQFSLWIRRNYATFHRNMGKLYVFLVLFVASPSGLVMAYYANGGIYSKISFSIQAVLWFILTYLAYRFAMKKEWSKHRNFMLRSYALTLSAISLRLFKWVIVSTFALPPMDIYKIVAWLGWIVNILIVEFYISRNNSNATI